MLPKYITGGLAAQRKKNERHEQKAVGISSPVRNATPTTATATAAAAAAAGGMVGNGYSTAVNSAVAVTPGQPPRKKLTGGTPKSSPIPNHNNGGSASAGLVLPIIPSPLGVQPVLNGPSNDSDAMML